MTQTIKSKIVPATMADLTEPRRQMGNIVQLRSTNEARDLLQAASHLDECGDCIEMACICLMTFVALLSGAALLRCAGIHGVMLTSLDMLAIAAGIAAVFAGCLALVHFIQFRQV